MSTESLKNAITADRPANIMQMLGSDKNKKQLASLAGKYMTGDRVLALCINAVRKTPRLMECDPQSVLGAMMAAAGLGLEPNTPTQQAFLIPYKKRVKKDSQWVDSYECQFQIGYRGFITLAYRSPNVLSIQAEAIHENDHFEHMQGSKEFLAYKKTMINRGPMIGAFCLIKLRDGAEVAVTMPLEELHKIRAKSETYNALRRAVDAATSDKDRAIAERKLAETPWVMWEDSMAAKTAIKQLVGKRLSLNSSDPLQVAANLDEREIDLSAMAEPSVALTVLSGDSDIPVSPEDDEVKGIEDQSTQAGFAPSAEEIAAVRHRELEEAGQQVPARSRRATNQVNME